MNAAITQSREWQKLQDDLGETSFLKQAENYQYLAILKKTKAGNYLYCPYGPVLKSQKALKEAVKDLQSLAKEKSAIFIRIEPIIALEPDFLRSTASSLGLTIKKSKDLNPKETWLLDLTGSDDDLKHRLPSRLLRYYKSATSKGITIETSKEKTDIRYLLKLQQSLAKEKGINTFSEHYLATELTQPFATLYLVRYQDPTLPKSKPEIIAAGLVFDDKKTRYNLQGAQNEQGRKLHATGILTIQLILDAKAKNLQTFDFWGIAPEGAPQSHPWYGFTNFKKTFSGYEERHTGTYDLILNPAKYQLYRLARQINLKLRK